MMSTATKHKPPSRIRYEQSHPIISCRVSKEFYDNLVRAKNQEGNSFTDILKLGLGKIENMNKKLAEAKKKDFNEGYLKGRTEAESQHKVIYHCNNCKKPMVIASPEEKKAIDEYMSSRWHHGECPKPKIGRIP